MRMGASWDIFLIIQDISEDDGPKKAYKTLLLTIFVWIRKLEEKLGENLYQFALEYAKELGCYNVTLHVWNDNDVYDCLGMKPRYTEMETILK